MIIKGIWATREVFIDGERLNPLISQQIYNHSPDGFNWGYGGSGPAQLALAILLKAGFDKNEAIQYHQQFKWQVVARWPQGDFVDNINIRDWLNKQDEWASLR